LIDGGPARFGVNFISGTVDIQSGETSVGGTRVRVAKVSVMQAPPLYHTPVKCSTSSRRQDLNESPAF
jgi:hypothetical protein